MAAVVLVVVGVAIWWVWPRASVPSGIARVVVLPFDNLGAGGDDALAFGITAEAESRLAAVPGLEVVAHESAMRYAGSDKPIARIASDLKATHVLSGSVHWDRSAAGAARVLVLGDRIDDAATVVEDLLRAPSHPDAVPLVWLDPRWEPLRNHPRLQRFTVGRQAAEQTAR